MQARYYDPVIGRFMSNDPVGYTAKNPVMSFNRYLYVNNNPYKYSDPNGEFLQLITGAIGAYTAYNQAKDLGFSDSEALIAGGLGAVIGVISGGAGGQVVSGILKTAVTQAAKNTTKQAIKATAKSTVAGATSGGVTQVVADAGGDIVQGKPVEIDSTKAIFKSVEGGLTAALATVSTVGLAGKSTLTEVAQGAVAISAQEIRREDK
jgi:uncharacterized protein RhaS with RHS repeats